MNDQQGAGTRFEQRLRMELESVVAERATEQANRAPGKQESGAPWRSRGPRLGLAGIAVAGIAVVALLISAGGSDTQAAFAVEARPEGKISVEVSSLEDPIGLEEALEQAGIPTSVTYLTGGMTCREPRFQAAPSPGGEQGALISGPVDGEGPLRFTIGRSEVAPGQTLVITARPEPGVLLLGSAEVEVAEGAVAPCDAIPAPEVGSQR